MNSPFLFDRDIQRRLDVATGADLRRSLALASGEDFRHRLDVASLTDVRRAMDLVGVDDVRRALDFANIGEVQRRFADLSSVEMRERIAAIQGLHDWAGRLSPSRPSDAASGLSIVQELRASPMYAAAEEAAKLSESLRIPEYLKAYRPEADLLAARLAVGNLEALGGTDRLRDPRYLGSFVRAAATGAMLDRAEAIDEWVGEAILETSREGLEGVTSAGEARITLDAAGLITPAWARERIQPPPRTRPEQSQRQPSNRIQRRFAANRPAPHLVEGMGFVHQTERTLRWALHEAMTPVYGPDWTRERLRRCGARNLLNRWKRRADMQGHALIWADWADYALIMCDPEHHATVFAVGFPDVEVLRKLIKDGGDLRGGSVHDRSFEPQHLLDLRLVWSALETGLGLILPPVLDDE